MEGLRCRQKNQRGPGGYPQGRDIPGASDFGKQLYKQQTVLTQAFSAHHGEEGLYLPDPAPKTKNSVTAP